MKLKHFLLVEDSPEDAELTVTALKENHCANDIVTVQDGEEALDYLHRRGKYEGRDDEQPCVILLDLKLPKVNGLEVLEHVKSDPDLRIIPVVMLTSSAEERDVLRSYKLGVNGYVVKPVTLADFIVALREIGVFWGVFNRTPDAMRDPRGGERHEAPVGPSARRQ